jgi:4-hydroxybenzoate polyprenyltransferase
MGDDFSKTRSVIFKSLYRMSKVIDFFRLIRFTNIIFIALTQLLFQFCIIIPILHKAGATTTLNTFDFLLLIFSTTLVAAAGYIINDYFDEKIDAINKPDKVFIEKSIRRRVAMALHFVFNGIALLIGAYLAYNTHNYKMALVNPLVAVLLWFYSTTYKKQLLVGNIVVSALCAFIIVVPVLYEKHLYIASNDELGLAASHIFALMFYYVLFAFFMTMIREIIKDMEDVQGDEKYNCRTLPVITGLRITKKIVLLISVITLFIMILMLINSALHGEKISFIYILLLVILPMVYFIRLLYNADLHKDFHQLSALIKIIIFTGILSMGVFSFTSLIN